jgi:hypothetical protein
MPKTPKSQGTADEYYNMDRQMQFEPGRVEIILERFANYSYERQSYRTEDGEAVEGILLDKEACNLLLRWWGKAKKPAVRGRPRTHQPLFANTNPYKMEFDEEMQKIVASGKKMRGAIKVATSNLAERHRVDFDTMRKRIRKK